MANDLVGFKKLVFLDVKQDRLNKADLPAHVKESDVLIVLLSPEYTKKPYTLLEVWTAAINDVRMVPVKVKRAEGFPNGMDIDGLFKALASDEAFAGWVAPGALDTLAKFGATAEAVRGALFKLFERIAIDLDLESNDIQVQKERLAKTLQDETWTE